MTYGTIDCTLFGAPATIALTDAGWSVPGEPELSAAFDLLVSPIEFGPADGDPVACAVAWLAEALGGTYELAQLPAMPAGTVY